MASLMGSLYIGLSGMQTSQSALNTVAHNLANIGTDGFTRQQVQQGTRSYVTTEKNNNSISWKQTGLGVSYNNCKQVRSLFIDQNYRLERGRAAFYDISVDSLNEIESQLQEINGNAFSGALNNLWVAVQELSKDPVSAVNQGMMVTRASEFIERAQNIYKSLTDYQDSLDSMVIGMTKEINNIGERIKELNTEITKIESGGQEHANDLRDKRNLLLDQLASYGKITYGEDIYGNVSVQFEGVQFVTEEHVNHIACDNTLPVDKGGSPVRYHTPYWDFAASKEQNKTTGAWTVTGINGAVVFDLTQKVSFSVDTDVGKLRALLLARGDHHGTYHDITDEPSGGFYNKYIAQSSIMNIEAEFDQMIKNICTAINEIYETAGSNPVMLGTSDGKNSDYHLFKLINENDCLNYDIDNKHVSGRNRKGYVVTNIKVNELYKEEPTSMRFVLRDGSEDKETLNRLKKAFTDAKYVLNPNVKTKTSINDYYNMLVSQIAISGSLYKDIKVNQDSMVKSIDHAREQIIGVSSDEELEAMIKYQQAYNASSRFVNAVSEMLEHIVRAL